MPTLQTRDLVFTPRSHTAYTVTLPPPVLGAKPRPHRCLGGGAGRRTAGQNPGPGRDGGLSPVGFPVFLARSRAWRVGVQVSVICGHLGHLMPAAGVASFPEAKGGVSLLACEKGWVRHGHGAFQDRLSPRKGIEVLPRPPPPRNQTLFGDSGHGITVESSGTQGGGGGQGAQQGGCGLGVLSGWGTCRLEACGLGGLSGLGGLRAGDLPAGGLWPGGPAG